MAFALHIERVDSSLDPIEDIEIEEWHSAVGQISGLRIATSPIEIVDPATNKVLLTRPADGKLAEMTTDGHTWQPVFEYHSGSISFNGRPSFLDQDDPVRTFAFQLAKTLRARIYSDDGDFLDRD